MNHPTPVSLKAAADALQIVWSDGVTHRISWKMLRDACPCATCREQREQRASSPAGDATAPSGLLPVISLAEAQPLRVSSMKPVGNYAYDIDFTDGHHTGIYTLEHLRALGEMAQGHGAAKREPGSPH